MHGHFYQPPRENPWTGEVDAEPSAAPFHDWNERIAKECYEANTHAPILNAKGEAVRFVNNFANISFDIGPTLLSWMRRKASTAYRAILDADRESRAKYGGHGNAMAQVYNHIIMPLASRRDKITQIVWGIADFEFHYGRRPEGMWLSETAVDKESLKLLAEHGISFTVLAPHQAARVRRIGFARSWETLHHDSVNPRHAYRVLVDGRQFHVFFYDGPLSRAIAFQGLLNNGDTLIHRIMGSFGRRSSDGDQLVSTATDGESFGHHHHFGEMAVAYALTKLRENKTVRVTNYAEFLERTGSEWEVELYENSSWSCAHGVERWRSDCGCRLNHTAGWNQKWRTVLREAFEEMQRSADRIFETQGGARLRDPWQARNEYIRVMLDPSEKQRRQFLARHARKSLPEADEKTVWDLLEAQKFCLFMYTSCGWFFDDISGIEPVQVMKFAARAMELVQPYHKEDLEAAFLKNVARAKSNVPENGTGADVYERFVKTARVAHGV